MNESVIEQQGTYKEYKFVVLFQPLGFRTAYVGVPRWHSLYEKHYKDIEGIECHGGLTYSSHELLDKEYPVWWIGFDCAHAGDFCITECKNIIDQLVEME